LYMPGKISVVTKYALVGPEECPSTINLKDVQVSNPSGYGLHVDMGECRRI